MTGISRQLPGKQGHSHLHWKHNVINCICGKSSISPSLPPLPITDHSPHFFKTRFLTWSPLVFISSPTTYLENHSICRRCQELISIKPVQEDFASLCKIIDQKTTFSPDFPFPIETKKSFLSPPPNRLPPSRPLTPPTLLKRQVGA